MFLDSPDRNTAQVWIHQLQQARGTAEEAKFYALAIDIFPKKINTKLNGSINDVCKTSTRGKLSFLSLFLDSSLSKSSDRRFLAINNSANDFQQHFRQFDGEENKIKVEVLRQRFIDEGPTQCSLKLSHFC